MKKINRNTTIILLGLSLMIIACQGKHDHRHSNDSESQQLKTGSGQEDQVGISSQLILNDGKKWIANAETTIGVQNMQKILAEYNGQNDISGRELGISLQQELDGIFKKCTMKGEAHEQLHVYLIPLLSQVKALNENEVSEDQPEEIKAYLNVYFDYFK